MDTSVLGQHTPLPKYKSRRAIDKRLNVNEGEE